MPCQTYLIFLGKGVIMNLRTDLCSEFKSKLTQNMLRNRNVNHIFSESQNKANFAESAIKHFKCLAFSYMKSKHTQKCIDQFHKIVQMQNKTFNISINTNPLYVWNNLNNAEL